MRAALPSRRSAIIRLRAANHPGDRVKQVAHAWISNRLTVVAPQVGQSSR